MLVEEERLLPPHLQKTGDGVANEFPLGYVAVSQVCYLLSTNPSPVTSVTADL